MSSKNTYINLISTLSIQSREASKYLKRYISLIENAVNREILGYTETHHIVPECFFTKRKRKGKIGFLGGTGNNKNNLVKLTPEEHLTVHLLLIKCFSSTFDYMESLIYVANMMFVYSKYNKRLTNKEYGWVKRIRSTSLSQNMKGENNPFYNKTHSDKSIQKMKSAKQGENNPCFNKIWITNGIDNKRIPKNQIIPEKWYPGRTLSKTHIKNAAENSIFGKQFFCLIESKHCYDKANLIKVAPEFKQYL
jgi:hypothetical protein